MDTAKYQHFLFLLHLSQYTVLVLHMQLFGVCVEDSF